MLKSRVSRWFQELSRIHASASLTTQSVVEGQFEACRRQCSPGSNGGKEHTHGKSTQRWFTNKHVRKCEACNARHGRGMDREDGRLVLRASEPTSLNIPATVVSVDVSAMPGNTPSIRDDVLIAGSVDGCFDNWMQTQLMVMAIP